MNNNKQLGLLQKDALIEKLAKAFYRIQGYVVREDYRMQNATHPQVKACVQMAITAIEEVEFALADLDEDEEIIAWQQGQSFREGLEYYFYNYGLFGLTLVTDPHLNLTRTEVHLSHQIIYVYEEKMAKELASRYLQEFLISAAYQMQALSQITFGNKNL
ncbi:hypothetical protein NIES2111_64190 (plasmid) [Nostoc sp. NIES-2111]|nr:hypothetical protein NIES2111_64190 [Nostoc sp. NIES-2111]